MVAAAILAGGSARRMGGVNKALIEVDGRPILARQLAVLAPLVDEILLVSGDPAPFAPFAGPRVRLLTDRLPGQGPLAGLDAAFAASDARSLLLFACDLPYLDPRMVTLVRDHAPSAQAVVPRVDAHPQPLHARYARSVAPLVRARLERGALRLRDLLTELAVTWLDEPALRAADPTLRALHNANSPADLGVTLPTANPAKPKAGQT